MTEYVQKIRVRQVPEPKVRIRVKPRVPPLEIEMQNTGVMVQWRVGTTGVWQDLIEIDDINASVSVGTVVTLPAGTPAYVSNVGTPQDVILNFGIPEGGVSSVNGESGAVIIDAGDVPFTPTGGIAATTVQTALAELDSEKLSAAQAGTLYQPLDSDLTAIAALATQTFGRARLTDASAADNRLATATPTYVASRTALKALDTTKDTVAVLTEAGRQGTFLWMGGNYSSQITADTAEGVYVKATAVASSSGAWVRIYADALFPEWFGAIGDNSTNDYAAVQAAIDLSITLRVAVFLRSFYKCGTALDAGQLSSTRRLTIRGAGFMKSGISVAHSGSGLVVSGTSNTAYSAYLLLQDFAVVAFAGSTPASGIRAYDLVRSTFDRVRVAGCTAGLSLFGGIAIDLEGCEFDSNVTGLAATSFVSGAGGGYPNLIAISNSRIISNTTFGIDFGAGRMLTLENSDVEGNGTNGVNNSGGIRIQSNIGVEGSLTFAPGLMVTKCWFESNAGAGALLLLGGTNSVRDCYFIANNNASYDIYIAGGAYRIEGTQHDSAKTVHIVEDGVTSSRNFINNCRKADGTRANIQLNAGRVYSPDLGAPVSAQISVLLSDFAGSNVNTAQPVFSSAQDTVTLDADTTYEFEAEYFITRAAGTTSHTTAVLFGGTATFDAIRYLAEVINPTGNVLAAVQAIRGDAATALVLTAANTSATENLAIKLKGRIRTNAAGTLIPQFQYSAAPGGAPTILANSAFRLWPIGNDQIAAIGPWA